MTDPTPPNQNNAQHNAQHGTQHEADLGDAPRVAVVTSRYNATITAALERGACDEFARRVPAGELEAVPAPGAFELVALSSAAIATGRFVGVCALGCVIKGDTDHDKYINAAVAHGLAELASRTGVPVAFGLLTTNDAAQAEARAGGSSGNKGTEAMGALLDTIAAAAALRRGTAPLAHGGRPDKVTGDRTGR